MSSTPVIELWEVSKLVPYEMNAKKHPPEQIAKLARSLQERGFTAPIVIDADGVIIAGHGRRLASIEAGLVKVPVICRRDLTKAQADALRLADNRLSSTDYDMSMIQDELRRLYEESAGDFDLALTGYDDHEIEFSTADLGDLDESMFVEDIGQAVGKQQDANKAAAQEVDDIAAPVTDALGFKRVTIEQSRTIRQLMARVESKTGKKGADAFIAHLEATA